MNINGRLRRLEERANAWPACQNRQGSPPVPAIVICPECSARLRVPVKTLGQEAKCPKCGTRITVNRVESLRPDWMTKPPTHDPGPPADPPRQKRP